MKAAVPIKKASPTREGTAAGGCLDRGKRSFGGEAGSNNKLRPLKGEAI